MTVCYLCGSLRHVPVLEKGAVDIWTDTGDDDSVQAKYPCVLYQCLECGHVYQPVNDELRGLFNRIYQSRSAQGPSAMGVGRWGLERAETLFFNNIDLTPHRTAAEIGCGDGYLLRELKARGFTSLTGIEPSANIDRADPDGLTFINDFVDEHLRLPEPVDLVYSVAVFEHIENVNGVLSFCRNNLRNGGELFFVVPNAQRQLERADPALFVHQHVHHFTEHSIRRLLAFHGFSANAVVSREDVFAVSASPDAAVRPDVTPWPRYQMYQDRVDKDLAKIAALLAERRVLVHGACNALNNIVGWTGATFDLADNDENRQGRRYFRQTVRSPRDLDLGNYDTVLIVPMAYCEAIAAQYRALGFTGRITGISTL
jgi:SAM-dependent methyltransferase